MLKLQEFNNAYESVKNEKLDCIMLEIHMPTGETENIVNPNVEEKVRYINKVYNDKLVHSSCEDIYITDYTFVVSGASYDFGWALALLKDGHKVTKKSWYKEGMYIELQIPDENSKMTAPYMYITIDGDYKTPWHPSQADMLEADWEMVN